MPDSSKKFHDFALKSILFKGRADWYFCYLKTERIAHVLALLVDNSEGAGELCARAGELPGSIAHLAAGEVDAAVVLADVFGLLSDIRTGVSRGLLAKETGAIVCKEYEAVAERLVIGSHPSPFVTPDDFRLAALPEFDPGHHQLIPSTKDIKDIRIETKRQSDAMSQRMSLILEFVRNHKQASIKDIAAVIKDCSEKTIQRELGNLIALGLVRKMGERRWSVYLPL